MDPMRISVEFLILSIAVAIFVTLRVRPVKKVLRSAIVAASCVTLVDFLIESSAHKLGFWHLYGGLLFMGVPLVFTAGWIFNGTTFCLLWAYRIKPRNRIFYPIFVLAGVSLGTSWNWVGSKYLGVMTFERLGLFHAFLAWLFLVSLVIFVYESVGKLK